MQLVKFRKENAKVVSIESAMVKKILLKWFNLKFKRQFDKIGLIAKMRYETKNKIDWKKKKNVLFVSFQ